MAAIESPETASPAPSAAESGNRRRELAFRIVLVGLVVLVVGFTATLVANAFYPCEPAAGSSVQPPIGDCAVSLTPWLGIAVLGLLIAVVGYLRVG